LPYQKVRFSDGKDRVATADEDQEVHY